MLIFFVLILVVFILENVWENFFVLRVLVIDVDESINGKVMFIVIGGLGLGKFIVD